MSLTNAATRVPLGGLLESRGPPTRATHARLAAPACLSAGRTAENPRQQAAKGPKANHLLAALPEAEWRRWLTEFEWVNLTFGQALYESGTSQTHVYFPTTAIVSLHYVMETGSSAEIAVVGNEGAIGISLFMGGESTPSQAVVQSAGQGYRLNASFIKNEFNHSGPVMHLLLRYTQALITQIAQTAVCNRHHSLDQRLCRWLLLRLDRLQANELTITQQQIANMLGVRREGVTEAAFRLQTAGLVRYFRGHISVLDRQGLEQRTCECYQVVKKECGRLLPPSKPDAADMTDDFSLRSLGLAAARHPFGEFCDGSGRGLPRW